jgi:hypothetical protein
LVEEGENKRQKSGGFLTVKLTGDSILFERLLDIYPSQLSQSEGYKIIAQNKDGTLIGLLR